MRRFQAVTWVRSVLVAAVVAALLAHAPAGADEYGGTAEGKGQEQTPEPDPNSCNPDSNGTPDNEPQTSGADPIGLLKGNWFYRNVDLEVPGVFPIRLVRRYDSQSNYQSALGAGWAFTYDMRLFQQPNNAVLIRNACGLLHRYTKTGNTWNLDESNPGWTYTLEDDPNVQGGFILSSVTGTWFLFDAAGLLKTIRNPQGNELRFTYDPELSLSGTSRYAINTQEPLTIAVIRPLKTIEEFLLGGTATGRKITFKYDDATGGTGRLEWAETHDERKITYSHEPAGSLTTGNLTSVLHPTGKVETFTYDTASPRRRHMVKTWQDGQGRAVIENVYATPSTADEPLPLIEEERERRITGQKVDGVELWSIDYESTSCTGGTSCTETSRHVFDDQATPGLIHTAVTTYQYNAGGYLEERIDPLLDKTVITYEAGRPFIDTVEVFDSGASQKLTDYTYSATGQLESQKVTLDNGHVIEEEWIRDPDDHGWLSKHKVTKDTNADGTPEETFCTSYTFHRRDENWIDSMVSTDPVTNIKTIDRHAKGTSDCGAVVETTELFYDTAHRLLEKVKFPDGHEIEWTQYTAGEDTATIVKNGLARWMEHLKGAGGADPHLKVTYDYDAQGRVNAITDALNRTADFVWDAGGRLKEIENARGEKTVFTYGGPIPTDPGDLLVEREDGETASKSGRATQLRYDSDGNLVTIDRQNGPASFLRVWTFTHDSDGNRLSQIDASSQSHTFTYDENGRLKTIEDSATHTTTFDYDAVGNRTQVDGPRSAVMDVTDFVYDELDRLISVTQKGVPTALVTEFEYDAAGNVTLVEDPKDQGTTYEYDGLSRLRKVIQAGTEEVEYIYDGQGRLERLINGRDHVLDYVYGPDWGGLTEVKQFEKISDAIANPQVIARTISYTHDLVGNVLSVHDDAQATQAVDGGTGYPAGRLYSFTYDDLDRVDTTTAHFIPGGTAGEGRTLDSGYNRFGDRTDLDLSGAGESLEHRWIFNELGRLTGVVLPPDPATIPLVPSVTFGYYGNGDLQTITHRNGLASTYAYKPHGPLDSITVADTSELHKLSYGVDPAWNITSITEAVNGTDLTPDYVYAYDGVGRLDDVTSYPTGLGLPTGSPAEDFAYDAAGNRDDDDQASSPWSYNSNNQIESSPTPGGGADTTYLFDDDGNVETITSPSRTQTFTFDKTNRLESWTDSTATASYEYDPFGRRISKAVGGVTTWFLWDGDQLLGEYDNAGTRQARYAYAGGYAPIQFGQGAPGSEAVYDVHTDHLGTPRMLTGSTKTVAWEAAYEAFGIAHLGAGNAVSGFNVRLPGQYYDAEFETISGDGTGLHYNYQRFYDPSIGRYASSDPIGQAGGLNLFTYTGNDPVNFFDPFGAERFRDKKARQRKEDARRKKQRRLSNKPKAPVPTEVKGGHTSNASPSKKERHQTGDARRSRDQLGSKRERARKRGKGKLGALLLAGSLFGGADDASAEEVRDALNSLVVPLPLSLASDAMLGLVDSLLESEMNPGGVTSCSDGPAGGDELAGEFTGSYGIFNRR